VMMRPSLYLGAKKPLYLDGVFGPGFADTLQILYHHPAGSSREHRLSPCGYDSSLLDAPYEGGPTRILREPSAAADEIAPIRSFSSSTPRKSCGYSVGQTSASPSHQPFPPRRLLLSSNHNYSLEATSRGKKERSESRLPFSFSSAS